MYSLSIPLFYISAKEEPVDTLPRTSPPDHAVQNHGRPIFVPNRCFVIHG
jgi:hypothetical protein